LNDATYGKSKRKTGWGAEELKSLGHLVEKIISRNPSSSGEELLAMNRLGQLVQEASRQLKEIRRENDSLIFRARR
jgi:hypothetical protein